MNQKVLNKLSSIASAGQYEYSLTSEVKGELRNLIGDTSGTLTVSSNGIYSTANYKSINVAVPEKIFSTINIIPSTVSQQETPEKYNVDAFNVVNVSAVTAEIDENIQPENIKAGTTILGVAGAYSLNLQAKTVTAASSQITISADAGYDGLSAVTINTVLQTKTVIPGTSQMIVTPDSPFTGLSAVIIEGISESVITIVPSTIAQTIIPSGANYTEVNVLSVTSSIDPNIRAENIVNGKTILGVQGTAQTLTNVQENKVVSPSLSEQVIYPDGGYTALSKITITPVYPESYYTFSVCNVTPSTEQQLIYPTASNGAFSVVGVAPVTPAIDLNIQSENIREGVNILGITGTYSALSSYLQDNIIVTPSNTSQIIIPDYPYSGFRQAMIEPIASSLYATIPDICNGALSELVDTSGLISHIIPSYAFANQSYLKKIDLPNCITISGASTFFWCKSLTDISLPLIENIPSCTFAECGSIQNCYIPHCKIIGFGAFSGVAGVAPDFLANFPELTTINTRAFYWVSGLSIASAPLVTWVGDSAFYYCSRLTTTNFPQCSHIGSYAFTGCENLTDVNLPECTTLSSGAFTRCIKLSSVALPKIKLVEKETFYSCNKLDTVSLPEVTKVDSSAFAYCSSLSYLALPKCQSVGASAFDNCAALEILSIPKCTNLTGNYTFRGCTHLHTIYLNEVSQVTSTGYNTFGGFNSGTLQSIYIPSSLYTDFISSWGSSWTSKFVSV